MCARYAPTGAPTAKPTPVVMSMPRSKSKWRAVTLAIAAGATRMNGATRNPPSPPARAPFAVPEPCGAPAVACARRQRRARQQDFRAAVSRRQAPDSRPQHRAPRRTPEIWKPLVGGDPMVAIRKHGHSEYERRADRAADHHAARRLIATCVRGLSERCPARRGYESDARGGSTEMATSPDRLQSLGDLENPIRKSQTAASRVALVCHSLTAHR